MDFTVKKFHSLLLSLIDAGYNFSNFLDYMDSHKERTIILRHDVDLLPFNSLRFAQFQAQNKVLGVYNFRMPHKSFDKKIIKQISELGHEIGYHYETMDTANGDINIAWDMFRYNLNKIRKLADVQTICMHGSPYSKFDNRKLWEKYDYKSLGIKGEPYFDINFNEVFYLTDTGRRWDSWKVSIRDKVPQQNDWAKKGLVFHSTNDVINSLKENRFPNVAMFVFHPQRWHNNSLSWIKELVYQNIKNQVKKVILYRNKIRKII